MSTDHSVAREPRQTIDYERLYQYRFRAVRQDLRSAVWRPISDFLYAEMGAPTRVLDPAAGRGEFINAVPAEERWAVDQVAYPEGTYDETVHRIVSDIFTAELPEAYFGGVFVSNFLEHLPTQNAAAHFLGLMCHTTEPDGRIVVIGPNFRYCQNQYFDMADHTLVLTHRAVAEHLYAAGYEVEKVIPRFLPYSFTGSLPASASLASLYLRARWSWRLFGKQFLVIGRRPRA